LQELEYLGIAGRVAGTPGFVPLRYALLASLDPQCLEVARFVPDPVRKTFHRSLDEFTRETEQANAVASVDKIARTRSLLDAAVRPQTETLIPFRYLVEEALGLSTSTWTLALDRETYDFTTARESRRVLERELFERVARADPDLRALRDRHDDYCAKLRTRSLASLGGVAQALTRSPP
jgi:hypothetical protein